MIQMALGRRLVAVFAADVEGYSRLVGADEVRTPLWRRCSAAQTALAEANTSRAPDRRISFRIGVHIGDVMVRLGICLATE